MHSSAGVAAGTTVAPGTSSGPTTSSGPSTGSLKIPVATLRPPISPWTT